jgi:uncharacterized protein (TIGR00369 family)
LELADIGKEIKRITEGGYYDQLKKEHPNYAVLEPEFVDYQEDGRLTLAYPVRESQRNGHGVMQGGLITTACDNNFGIFTYLLVDGATSATIDINTHFHQAVTREDQKVWVTSRIVKRGRRVIHLAAEMYNAKQQLIATCYSNVIMLGVN